MAVMNPPERILRMLLLQVVPSILLHDVEYTTNRNGQYVRRCLPSDSLVRLDGFALIRSSFVERLHGPVRKQRGVKGSGGGKVRR